MKENLEFSSDELEASGCQGDVTDFLQCCQLSRDKEAPGPPQKKDLCKVMILT